MGISVSRVGGKAQIKSMKKVAGTLKLDQAQYRELEAFAKFGSDLDAATLNVLDKGAKNVEILKQNENSPLSIEEQIAIIFCGTSGLLKNLPLEKVKTFETNYLEALKSNHADLLAEIASGEFNNTSAQVLTEVALSMVKKLAN